MPEPGWESAGFDGAERELRRRVAQWTPVERLAWLEAAVLDAHRSGLLLDLRRRKQEAVLAAWRA